MKKRNVINLIRYHQDRNESAFRNEAAEITHSFMTSGDEDLAEYVMALISDANAFVPQTMDGGGEFFRKLEPASTSLSLPDVIVTDVKGICNAIAHNVGVNKFLFQEPPSTGKTETARQISRITARNLYMVDFNAVIDSKLGQTAKNTDRLFEQINQVCHPNRVIVFFDEIDALVLDRVNQHDVRETERATSVFLKALDPMTDHVVLITTINPCQALGKALARRLNATIDFGRYERENLLDIAEMILGGLLRRFKTAARGMRLFRKVISLQENLPYPGELENMLRTVLVFSKPGDSYDYLRRLHTQVRFGASLSGFVSLGSQGFTLRKMEALSGVPKSTISREMRGATHERPPAAQRTVSHQRRAGARQTRAPQRHEYNHRTSR